MAMTPRVGSTASRRPAAKAAIAQVMVPAKAMGSIRLRGSPAIHALVTPACTWRVEMCVNFSMKNGPAFLNLMSRMPAMNCWTRRLRPWLVSLATSLIVRTRLRVMRMNDR